MELVDRILTLDPTLNRAHEAKVLALGEQDRFPEAIAAADRAIEALHVRRAEGLPVAAQLASMHLERGRLRVRLGSDEEALAELRIAMEYAHADQVIASG